MATKSLRLQKWERTSSSSKAKAAKKPRRRRDVDVDTSRVGVSATDRKAGLKNGTWLTQERNVHRAGKPDASFALEDSATGQPSRKFTRSSSNHIKPDSNLRRRQTRKTRSPQVRHAKAAARQSSPRGH